jgi:hypothetical protein
MLYQEYIASMINACGAIGGMRIGREAEVLGEITIQCQFVLHKSHII